MQSDKHHLVHEKIRIKPLDIIAQVLLTVGGLNRARWASSTSIIININLSFLLGLVQPLMAVVSFKRKQVCWPR
jgi:hypothetical protein